MAIEADRYRREIEGDFDWSPAADMIADTNRRALAAHPDRDIGRNLDWLADSVHRYAEGLSRRDPDQPSHHLDAGLVLAPRHAAGLLLGELLVHRRDLDPHAPIDPAHAALVMEGAIHAMPGMVDKAAAEDFTGTFELRLRGHGRYALRVDHGAVEVDGASAPRRDATISADPVAFLLLSYGRLNPVRAAVTLKAVTWGRRPDKAFALDRIFHKV